MKISKNIQRIITCVRHHNNKCAIDVYKNGPKLIYKIKIGQFTFYANNKDTQSIAYAVKGYGYIDNIIRIAKTKNRTLPDGFDHKFTLWQTGQKAIRR